MIIAGNAVASKLIASPWMTFVPWPVVEAFDILCTGLKFVPVYYWVTQIIKPVITKPTRPQ